jgi:hypothetical protein
MRRAATEADNPGFFTGNGANTLVCRYRDVVHDSKGK